MQKELNWKFDISTYRLLGRELITDDVTAIVELVKNSYDANSKNVYIKFFFTQSKTEKSKIVIVDDGFGMTADDIEQKWMTFGTSSKRKEKISPPPFNRRAVGEKGVGRFAIDKLGRNCKIISKKSNELNVNILQIDWSQYEHNTETDDFLKVNNFLKIKKLTTSKHGTKIIIKDIHEEWTSISLDRLYKELAKIVSPLNTLVPPFNIYIQSNQFDAYLKPKKVVNKAIKYASDSFSLTFNCKNNIQEVIKFNKKDKSFTVIEEPIYSFGPVKLKLYHFDQYAKGNFSKNYKGADLQIDGVKIYRDGILTTPFAENTASRNNRRDILGIDKRRYSGFFDKIGSRDMIGIVEIYKDTSPKIIDATNRQDFLSNVEYKELKEFIISQIAELEDYLIHKKKEEYAHTSKELSDAKNKINDFSSDLKSLKDNIAKNGAIDIKKEFKKLENSARKANIALKQSIKTQKNEEKESLRKEKMYMSLMSLQTYAHEITHIIKTSIGSIKRLSSFNNKYFGIPKYEEQIAKYNGFIVREINKLTNAIEFMSRYTKSEKNWKEFNVKKTIEYVYEGYTPIFEKENIKVKIDIQKEVILKYNNVLFEDILKNLLNNSIKALTSTNGKLIKVSGVVENDNLIIYVSDNGEGIEAKNKDKIYEVYFTTTAEEGGNGMGLYMVKTNLAAIKGQIQLIESEYGKGTTFKLTLPFNKEEI